jgi:flagellar basal-body rod modification protein FlgD
MFTVGQTQTTLDTITQNTDKVNFKAGQANLGNSKLTKDGFMQLLLAQLKSQDPTNPVSDKEFVQQQAALTQIEKLDELSSTLKQTSYVSQATGLAGKQVTVKGADQVAVTGTVSRVDLSRDSFQLTVNGNTYSPSQLQTVYSNP